MKMIQNKSRLAGLILLSATVPIFAQSTTQPTTHLVLAQTATAQPSVASLLSDVDAAYARLQTVKLEGHIVGKFDVGGQQNNPNAAFTSAFSAPNKFRHELTGDIVLDSTGTDVFAYRIAQNEYQTAEAPKARGASTGWPGAVARILAMQNPSLMLAMSKSAATELKDLSAEPTLQTPTVIDGTAYPTLLFDVSSDHRLITMLIDPATHLLHEVKFDMRKVLVAAGATDVKQAEFTVDYTHSEPDAPVDAAMFPFTVPAGAVLASATEGVAADGGADDLSDALKALIGKPAPDFTLKGLDDKNVKLSDTKGSVVVLDFWATWCGPCVRALPHVDKLFKDQSANGLKVFAVNLQEEKDKVQAFVKEKGWTLPVILDSDAAAAGLYKAESIPETVVIGKDGTVKKIFVGSEHEDEIAKLVAKEMQ